MKIDNIGTKRMIYKIISVFISIILWLFITYTEDSQIDFTVNAIDIRLTGESTLNEQGLMVINKSTIPNAAVRVRGKRRDIISVMGNIGAYVDLSGIGNEGTYTLTPTFDIPSNAVYISQRKTIGVEVDIAKIESKTIDVEVVQKNAEMNKSHIIESVPNKQKVVIKGEHNDIESIDHASVYIDVGSCSQGESVTGTLIYENAENSEVICINDLFCEINEIAVENKVYNKHEIPLKIAIPSEFNKKYAVQLLEKSADSVEVGIKNEDGLRVSEISNLPFSGELEVGTKEYEFTLDVPDSLYIPKDRQKVWVKLEVYEKNERLVTLPIRIENTKGRGYELAKNEISVWVSGPDEKLTSEYVNATLNLDKYEPGDYEQLVTVEITTEEKDIYIGDDKVDIKAKIK